MISMMSYCIIIRKEQTKPGAEQCMHTSKSKKQQASAGTSDVMYDDTATVPPAPGHQQVKPFYAVLDLPSCYYDYKDLVNIHGGQERELSSSNRMEYSYATNKPIANVYDTAQ